MTDKVQKIKDWISKTQDGLMDAQGNFERPEHEGAFHILSNLDYYIDSLQAEPVSEDLEKAADSYIKTHGEILGFGRQTFKAGANWQKAKDQEIIETAIHHAYHNGRLEMKEQITKDLWKSANGDDLPEIDREVVVLTQPYSDDNEHLRVAFAHRPNKYAKVWNSDLGEEQVVEIERYGKGGWNIPDVKYWLDCSMPKEIEL